MPLCVVVMSFFSLLRTNGRSRLEKTDDQLSPEAAASATAVFDACIAVVCRLFHLPVPVHIPAQLPGMGHDQSGSLVRRLVQLYRAAAGRGVLDVPAQHVPVPAYDDAHLDRAWPSAGAAVRESAAGENGVPVHFLLAGRLLDCRHLDHLEPDVRRSERHHQ